MATELNFTKKGIWYVCELNPSEPTTIQVQLKKRATFDVRQRIGDMPSITVYSTDIYDNLIFQVDVPDGVTVELASLSPVIKAVSL